MNEFCQQGTVLVVDDNPANLGTLFEFLSKRGFTTLVAQSGKDAIELLKEVTPDIILLDVLMPEMDGFETCRYLKQKPEFKDIPIIFISALSEVKNRLIAFQSGGYDYITKPFDKDEVIARVETHIHLQRLKKELQVQNEKMQEEIAQRKQIEEELRKARLLAEQANHAKTQFLAKMSHEIRTPLNSIMGMARLLLENNLDPECKDYAQTILDSSEILLSLINDLLDVSKIEAGRLSLNKINFSLRSLLEKVGSFFSAKAKEKGLSFSYTIEETLPSHVRGDPHRLEQILYNLLGNALKFTHIGWVKFKVSLAEETKTGWKIRFIVSDSGVGIPQQIIPQLFTPFFQINSKEYGGTGLGLSICKYLVQAMQGDITLESAEGIGSTFSFTIVLEKSSSKAGEEKREHIVPGLEKIKGKKILVVEDNIMNQKVVIAILKRLGVLVDIVNDGKEALTKLEKEPYDIVLMDIQMANMDGVEATKRIRALDSHVFNHSIPIIAMTAHAMKGDREYFLSQGMTDYISKPIYMEELVQKLVQYLA